MRFMFIPAILIATATPLLSQEKTTEETTTESQTIVDSASGKVITRERTERVATREDLTYHRDMIYLDPWKFASLFNVGYQRALSRTITVGGVIQSPSQLTNRSGFGIIAEGRFYPGESPFRSFHVGANISYNYIREQFGFDTLDPFIDRTLTPLALGVVFGWHWYSWDDFGVEFAFGGDFVFNGEDIRDPNPGDYFMVNNIDGLTPSFRMQFSYAW